MKHLLMAHDRKMLDTQDKERRMCDCKKQDCPVNESCLMENVKYIANVTTENQTKFSWLYWANVQKPIYKTQTQLQT